VADLVKCRNWDTSSVPTLHKNDTVANSSSEKATLLGQCFSQHFNLSESLLTPDDITHSDLSVLDVLIALLRNEGCLRVFQ